ncbi:MAG TPA: hypothetical protein VHB72_02035 [Candidatus Saccharimonadales bacterium]|nr:hypothetical protein [Candidatus Saccharimonadales bacterium]
MTIGNNLDRLKPEVAERIAGSLEQLDMANFIGTSLVCARTDNSSEGLVTQKWLERSLLKHMDFVKPPEGFVFGISSIHGALRMARYVAPLSEGIRPEGWKTEEEISQGRLSAADGMRQVFIAGSMGISEAYQFEPGIVYAYSVDEEARCRVDKNTMVDIYPTDEVLPRIDAFDNPVISMPPLVLA